MKELQDLDIADILWLFEWHKGLISEFKEICDARTQGKNFVESVHMIHLCRDPSTISFFICDTDVCKSIILNLIETRLTEVEKALIL